MSKEQAQVQSAAERRAELLRKKAEREKALEMEREAYELALLELEEKCSEGGRVRGRQFEILDLSDIGEEPIAVRCDVPGIQALFKTWVNTKTDDASRDAFNTPCVASPSVDVYRQIVARRPVVAVRTSDAICLLLGAQRADSQKKA